ncbi:MAG TPA: DUF4331 domain-containing protein [Candidatus Binatia bacterium]|nr:DUF4331 domain-containing protein [Candidatus Binatia bacterium]
MKKQRPILQFAAVILLATCVVTPAFASSHQDAPLVVLDPAANTTDVYAFVDQEAGEKSLVVALGVYPFEEPGIGPNKHNFDDTVLYEIHVALGADVAAGHATISYQFNFTSRTKNLNTTLYNYTGVIEHVDDAAQNFVQSYTVTKVDHRGGHDHSTVLGSGVVPPNNQGFVTPFYNQDNNGENPAREGVAARAKLDRYTTEAIKQLNHGYVSFAGQRDDGFYADIRAIFDLLQLKNPGKDNQGGFNLHLMALEIPITELGGDQQIVGVYATTSRRQIRIFRKDGNQNVGKWVQVARQGNPLFNEGLVAIADKDRYSRSSPTEDGMLFRKYAETPELAALINTILLGGSRPEITHDRTDIAAIYIPDLIKVDLSTRKVRFAGGGANDPTNPDDPGYSRLSIFGGDVLKSKIQDPFGNGGFIPGGWPNGRRFGDDVTDIAIDALLSDLRVSPPVINLFPPGDGVDHNDQAFNKVFPYESTPQNGRIHGHHGLPPE